MSTPTGRDNGLPPASRYVALVDVDPPVADHVLALLRDAGVTAVAEPITGDRGPTREVPPVRRPTERVHVDHGHVDLAQQVVAQALPGLRADFHADAAHRADVAEISDAQRRAADPSREEVDARFADIIAGFDGRSADPVPRWSALEDVDDEVTAADLETLADTDDARPRPPLSSRLVRRGDLEPDADPPVEDPDDHFVPPPPPPLPEVDHVTRFAWAALLGGPGLLLIAALLGLYLQSWLVVVALVSFVAGFATLVARMRDRHHDGWDDGAIL